MSSKATPIPTRRHYALLNGSRILHSVETQNVAISKRAAGTWALEHLPDRWQPALRAALRNYDGRPAEGDVTLLAEEMAPFVAYVRERVPHTDGRQAEVMPRWSGY